MSRTTSILARLTLVVLASAALYMTTAASASAGWFIEASELTGTAALATTASVDENFKIKAAGVTVECKGKNLEGVSPQVEAGGTATASSLVFTECGANANCTVTKTIGTLPVRASFAEGTSPAAEAVFLPKTGTIFATIKYNGAECALLGTQPVKGTAAMLLPVGEEEKAAQPIEAKTTETTGELKVGSSNAELKGTALLELASGQEFTGLFSVARVDVERKAPATGKLTFAAKGAEGLIEYKNNEAVGGKNWFVFAPDITDGGEYQVTDKECSDKIMIAPQVTCKFKVKLIVNPTGKTRLFFVDEAPLVSLKS